MNVTELIENLSEQGVQLWADNNKLRINSPKGILTPELRANLATHKTAILEFLQQQQDNSSCDTAINDRIGLSLTTIGRLLGGASAKLPGIFKPPIIEPRVMAQKLQVTLRPLPQGYNNQLINQFREELQEQLSNYGVQIINWEQATREFTSEVVIPLTPFKKTITRRVVKSEISAVIDVERPVSWWSRAKSFVAEKIYQIYANYIWQGKPASVMKIAQLIGWAEDYAIQILEDPTATQVILINELDPQFCDRQLPYQDKIAIGVNTLVRTFSEIAIGVSAQEISILNMNLADSLFPREKLAHFVLKSLIPKIYVPISPLPMSQFEVGTYNPHQSLAAKNLVNLSQQLATTGLFPSGFKLSEVIQRQSHRDIVDAIVNGRTGVSYGFVAYAEPPQYVGELEVSPEEWAKLETVPGFNSDQVRQNHLGRRYLKVIIGDRKFYKQIPDIWLVSARSGANKTNLNLETDLLRIGLKQQLYLEIPEKIDPKTIDIKPSYDTYVMVAMALAAALYAPKLIEKGAPMIHFHGYPAQKWLTAKEYYAGVEHPSVPCGTYESGVFNFLGIHKIAYQTEGEISLATLIEPDHGTNIMTSNIDYLMNRLKTGIEGGQIELGGKHFASLAVAPN